MPYRILLRRDNSINWSYNDPVLMLGEPGVESNTGKLKIGDGQSPWSALPYTEGVTGPQGDAGTVSDIPPGSTGSAGATGQLALDSDFLYVCIGTNSWKRTTLTSW